jgi:hypothetical protein
LETRLANTPAMATPRIEPGIKTFRFQVLKARR